ncbi:MAG: hypothetical protein WA746_19280 [Isosphaeraceae bacterium]
MDPVENASRWSRWAASGPASAISKVFGVLDANLPNCWRRLTGDDLLPYTSMVKPGSGWYALDTTPSYVGVVLSIERPRESELRGGWVWFAKPPYPTGKPSVPAAWDQVSRFLDEGVIPAARAAGANIRVPTPEDAFFSNLPVDIRDRLQTFSDAARKCLPLNREEAELWREFVIAAFRAKAVIDAQPFIDWLAAAGWPRETAAELNLRFFDHCLLLSRYADEVSAA